MAFIDTVDEQAATGELKEVYDKLLRSRGKVANIMKVHSLNPRAMQAHMDLYLAVMFGRSGLKRAERELIAVVVSATNGCAYRVQHHAEALESYWKDSERVQRLRETSATPDCPGEKRRCSSTRSSSRAPPRR